MNKKCKYCSNNFDSYNGLQKYCSVQCAIKSKLVRNNNLPKINQNSCNEYIGTLDKDGYGQITYSGKGYKVHRVIYEKNYGKLKSNEVVRHICDNRKCCEPMHLESGTQADNIQDMIKRGRKTIQRGEQASRSKLTEEQAKEIKYSDKNIKHVELAKKYNVTPTSISLIRRGKNWQHI